MTTYVHHGASDIRTTEIRTNACIFFFSREWVALVAFFFDKYHVAACPIFMAAHVHVYLQHGSIFGIFHVHEAARLARTDATRFLQMYGASACPVAWWFGRQY
jgi:hypothetical protein